MTAISKGQREIKYKEDVMLYYQGALWENCRISAFYPGQTSPDLVFIDVDAKDFCSGRALKTALTKILNRIKNKIGGHPTVLWSGRGFHILQPIDCTVNLNNIEELRVLVRDKDVNKAFLQFAADYLSDNKKDSCNRASLRSCLLRIPGSLNSKCKEMGIDPEVKIIQEWDGFRPDYKLMIGSFYSHLVDKRQQELQERAKYTIKLEGTAASNNNGCSSSNNNGQVAIHWIEKLLHTPIDDYRQRARDLIIIPYLVVRRGMTDEDHITSIVMQWACKCDELEPLKSSQCEFGREVRSRIHQVMRDMVPPMKYATLQEENPELAKKLSISGGA